jgi:hypothetical protein
MRSRSIAPGIRIESDSAHPARSVLTTPTDSSRMVLASINYSVSSYKGAQRMGQNTPYVWITTRHKVTAAKVMRDLGVTLLLFIRDIPTFYTYYYNAIYEYRWEFNFD